MLEFLAQATQTAAPQGGTQAPPFIQVIAQYAPLIIVLVVMYFFFISTKRKEEKNRKAMIDSLKKGDRIQTIGGVLGTVVNADADEITVKVDETTNTKVRFVRSAVHRVVTAEDKKADAK